MACRSSDRMVETTRLETTFYGPYNVGHIITHSDGVPGIEHMLYARQGIAVGKGQYGQIYLELALNESARCPRARAVKEVNKKYSSDHRIDWKREVEALALLSTTEQNELFVSFFGWYENPETVFIAMEYFELGDLSKYVKEIDEEDDVKSIAKQLVAGLYHMHEHSIVHRDLNPRNVFVAARTPSWRVKIADFGSSKRATQTTGLWTTTGTSGYMAPEYCDFMRDNSEYPAPTPAVDLWSLGCVIYELFTKERPFSEQHKAFEKYCHEPVLPDRVINSFASQDAQNALRRFLEPAAEDRITAEEARSLLWLEHEFQVAPLSSVVHEDLSESLCNTKLRTEHSSLPPFALHSMESSVSLATTATLVDEPDSSSTSLRNIESCPRPHKLPYVESEMSSPILPPRLPPRRASERTQSSQSSTRLDAGTIAPVTRATTPMTWSTQSSISQPKRAPSFPSGGARDPFSPPLPPRRPTRPSITPLTPSPQQVVDAEQSQMPEDASLGDEKRLCGIEQCQPPAALPQRNQQESYANDQSQQRSDSFPSYQGGQYQVPKSHNVPEQDIDAQQHGSWLITSHKHEELFVSLGPLPAHYDAPPVCDLCDERMRMTGARRIANAQNFLHLCQTCGNDRILCERCARDAINSRHDPHEADHILRRVGPTFSFRLEPLLHETEVRSELRGGLPPSFNEAWLESDHGFQAPAQVTSRRIRASLVLDCPTGIHQIVMYLRVAFDRSRITTDAMGAAQKKYMKLSKTAFGYISVGAQTLDADAEPLAEQYMPPNTVEKEVVYVSGRNDYNLTIPLKVPIQVQPNQSLEVVIRSSHDTLTFKNGCPYKWYLNYIGLSQFGEKTQLATKGQLGRRLEFVEQQRKHEHQAKIDRRINYGTKALQIGTMTTSLAGAVSGFRANQRKKHAYAMGEVGNYIHAVNGLYAGSNASVAGYEQGQGGGHYYDPNAWEGGSVAGHQTAAASEMTQDWVASQSVNDSASFVGTFESVAYTVGDNGGASATYTYYGVS